MKNTFRRWRLIPSEPARGSFNMALDDSLLHHAAQSGFVPTIRFMQWQPPALSLGRFQEAEGVDIEACRRAGIDVVRRATGGEAVLHWNEFTYTVVLPSEMEMPSAVVEAYEAVCEAVQLAFTSIGLATRLKTRRGERLEDGSCFTHPGVSDLVHDGRKICGSAQSRRGGALLQHGSVLLNDQSHLIYELLALPPKVKAANRERFRRGCLNLAEVGLAPARDELEEAFRAGFAEAFEAEIGAEPATPQELEYAQRSERAFMVAPVSD